MQSKLSFNCHFHFDVLSFCDYFNLNWFANFFSLWSKLLSVLGVFHVTFERKSSPTWKQILSFNKLFSNSRCQTWKQLMMNLTWKYFGTSHETTNDLVHSWTSAKIAIVEAKLNINIYNENLSFRQRHQLTRLHRTWVVKSWGFGNVEETLRSNNRHFNSTNASNAKAPTITIWLAFPLVVNQF